MHPMLNIAVRAARKAGNLIAKNYETPDAVEASQKGSNDFVTNVDKAAEAVIIDTIRKSYPQHTIITEESGELEGTDQDVQWVIDPLDGTTNGVITDMDGNYSLSVKEGATIVYSYIGYLTQEKKAAETLNDVREAMKINYFDGDFALN